MTTVPELALDLFSDAAIRSPYPLYREIRDAGPAVWMTELGLFALGRYDDARAALRAGDVLVSGRGVSMNDFLNAQPTRATLTSDGSLHRQRRGVLMRPMMPSALVEVRAEVEKLADEVVAELVARDAFDGIADFARRLPVSIVSRLVGLPEEGRERMLEWAAAGFDAVGPLNARAQAAMPQLLEMFRYAGGVRGETLRPEGWAARIFAAATAGALDPDDVPGLLIDYIAPSLDTTILATGSLLFLLGGHPGEYAKVRAHPELIPAAVNEALRCESPVRAFTRYVAAPYRAGEVSLPEGARVLVLYGSANRDERRYEDPERFDVTRDARDHLAFGHGVHRCAGGHLAQLELESLLRALTRRVRHIEVGEPEVLMSNGLRGYRAFPASFQ